jgi:hypothetical protein
MTQEQLDTILKQLSAKLDKDGWWAAKEGSMLAVQVAHDGVSMPLSRIEALRVEAGIVTARTHRREVHCFELEDVFAVSSDAGGDDKGRRPGFG